MTKEYAKNVYLVSTMNTDIKQYTIKQLKEISNDPN